MAAVELIAGLVDHPWVVGAWIQSEIDDLRRMLNQIEKTMPPSVFAAAHLRGRTRDLTESVHFAVELLRQLERPSDAPIPVDGVEVLTRARNGRSTLAGTGTF